MPVDARQQGKPGTHSVDLPLKPGRHDYAIADLPAPIEQLLRHADLPWLNSWGFCTMYEIPLATRVMLEADAQGRLRQAGFYRESRWAGGLRAVEFSGLPDLPDDSIVQLLAERGAHLATVHRMGPPEIADKAKGASHRNVIPLTHNVIVDLPPTKEAYLQSLGKQKRQQLPRYWRRLQREFDNLAVIHINRGAEIQLDHILQLVRFNQTRMESQGKVNATIIESSEQKRRWPLTADSGLLCTIQAQGRLLGGTFNYVHGHEAFLITIGHDPQLEHLNAGHVGLWKTIEHLIELGVRRYHLFWGRKLYKTQYGGVDHPIGIWLISRHQWLVLLWKLRWHLQRQIHRAAGFSRSFIGRLTGPAKHARRDAYSSGKMAASEPGAERR